ANRLRIECALPVFIEEQATRYQYFLEGSDAGWSEWTTETVKEYTNLHEGQYRVRIRAEDASGQPSLETACEFQILPPWYRTWWAYLSYLAGFAWVGMGIIRWRVQTLEDQKEALEQIVVERTQTVTQQNAELDAINRQLAENVEQLRQAQLETERKNQELQLKNEELIASQQRADRIFSALAQALPGTVLDGKYRLDSKIGEGGFGAVFRGTHLGLNRPIAIKVFKPSHGNDSADAVERFRREGVSASRLNHPNAVRVLDFGISEQGIAYLVMELLQGHSLYHEMRLHRVLSPTRTADILVPICSALAEAHRLGIIHRDIKPENIFLNKTPEGEIVKVVDFGVAKLAKTESGGQLKQLTETGMVVGTPIYVAPERLTSDVFDGKSDVYSLGIMLFQMLTGTLPFNPFANNPMQVFLAALHIAPPAPNKINPKLSPEVSAVVLSALEKDPNRRPTVRELARAFVKAVNQTDMPETSEWIAPNLTSEAERPQFVTDPGWNVQTLGGPMISHEP
ncbi:MAG TPA: protein kinase, partial [Acidobacteriota bacterium]|nr:protein kinase [Acidobacteriota bacterium]